MGVGTRRVIVNNAVVGEFIGDTFVHRTHHAGRRRTYAFSKDGMKVTVGNVTEEIEVPWAEKKAKERAA